MVDDDDLSSTAVLFRDGEASSVVVVDNEPNTVSIKDGLLGFVTAVVSTVQENGAI